MPLGNGPIGARPLGGFTPQSSSVFLFARSASASMARAVTRGAVAVTGRTSVRSFGRMGNGVHKTSLAAKSAATAMARASSRGVVSILGRSSARAFGRLLDRGKVSLVALAKTTSSAPAQPSGRVPLSGATKAASKGRTGFFTAYLYARAASMATAVAAAIARHTGADQASQIILRPPMMNVLTITPAAQPVTVVPDVKSAPMAAIEIIQKPIPIIVPPTVRTIVVPPLCVTSSGNSPRSVS